MEDHDPDANADSDQDPGPGLKTFRTFPLERATPQPSLPGGDVRASRPCVRHFVRALSTPGDVVFDPFAGFGTTLTVAAALGREPLGVEYEPDRVAYARDRLREVAPGSDPAADGAGDGGRTPDVGVDPEDAVRHGDARALDSLSLPAVDCCITSPPYDTRGAAHDPFENYAGASDYETYLDDLAGVLASVADLLVPDGTVGVEVANLRHPDGDGGTDVTTLAWDVARAVRTTPLSFRTEVVVGWEDASQYGYDHAYWLVFDAPGG